MPSKKPQRNHRQENAEANLELVSVQRMRQLHAEGV
jgi:hypothetical protein